MTIFLYFFFLFFVYRVRHRRSSTPAHFKIHFSVCRHRIESVITFHLSVGHHHLYGNNNNDDIIIMMMMRTLQ